MRVAIASAVMLLIALTSAPAPADTLLLEGLQAARPTASERPRRGMSMNRVETAWGTPGTRQGPVGEPPITRWEYPGFVVFFEYDKVIHAVQTH